MAASSTRQATIAAQKAEKGAAARRSGYAVEQAACTWLAAQGLRIVERNVRYKFGEIDIVAWEGGLEHAVLVLFEVRLRKNTRFGSALDSVTPRKQQRLWAAAAAYSQRFKPLPPMRVDVLAYSGLGEQPVWIKNALG
jgi:putative endonuclease